MTSAATMHEYATKKTGQLLDTAVSALCLAAQELDEEAVHKMRVALRRFQQALRLFKQYLKPKGAERIKSQIRAIMNLAGELRNRDIALKLTSGSKGATALLTAQRQQISQQLSQELLGIATPYLAEFWRKELGLEAP